jgi:hypothetical protein
MPRSPLNPVEGQGVRQLRLEFRLMRKPRVPLSGRTLQPKDLTRVLHRPVELAVVKGGAKLDQLGVESRFCFEFLWDGWNVA